jgi:5'(3')-deoxyribonucleotidase
LVAMEFNPNYMAGSEVQWESVHRTDFCHWINSIYVVLNKYCNVFVLTNYSWPNELKAKEKWLKENLKCNHQLILNKEGITKSLFVNGKNDILVDDTFRNLIEWNKVGGTQIAYQWVTCEKGRRQLLELLVK